MIDDGIAIFFAAPASFTGEDVAELHLHGGRAVLSAVFGALGARAGFRMAEPGEFTRRAFLNGKLDLTGAEAIADLVAAETAAQRRQALRQLSGEFGRVCEGWRLRLLRLQAQLEAEIDFPEEDLPAELWASARGEVEKMAEEIKTYLADSRRGERLRDGVSVAILGPPNSGKSSLMNLLARREVAITSHVAGTTRDVIEVALDLDGLPVVLADTAGLRETEEEIEREGVRRAHARAAAADLRLIVLDVMHPEEAETVRALIDETAIIVGNKVDLAQRDQARWIDQLGSAPALRISAATGQGISHLIERLRTEIAASLGSSGAPVVTRARHRAELNACTAALGRFLKASLPELAAEELRAAAQAVGRITGRVDVEDMLDVLFAEFCIGK